MLPLSVNDEHQAWKKRKLDHGSAFVTQAELTSLSDHSSSDELDMTAHVGDLDLQIHLPDEIWALVMECLPYKDVMQVAASSRHFLQRVMPKVTRINVFCAAELHARQARRLPNVTFCYLNCLLKQAPPEIAAAAVTAAATSAAVQIRVDYDSATADRIVPFLSRFRKLRFAFCGAIIYEGPQANQMLVWNGETIVTTKLKRLLYDPRTTTNDRSGQMHRGLVRAVCGGMASGVLNKHLQLNGLTHPKLTLCPKLGMVFNRQQAPNQNCAFCDAMVKNLPVNSLLQMTNHMLCCVPVAERFAEIKKRGGVDHLKKPARFEFVVKHCFKAFYIRPNTKMVAVMKNSIDELKALADAGLDPNSVDIRLFYNELKALQGDIENFSFSQQAFDQIRAAGYMLDSTELSQRGIALQDFSLQDEDRQGRLHHLFAHAMDRAQPIHAFQRQVRINPHGDGGEINQVFDEIRNQFQQLRERLAVNPNLLRPVDGDDELPAEIVD